MREIDFHQIRDGRVFDGTMFNQQFPMYSLGFLQNWGKLEKLAVYFAVEIFVRLPPENLANCHNS